MVVVRIGMNSSFEGLVPETQRSNIASGSGRNDKSIPRSEVFESTIGMEIEDHQKEKLRNPAYNQTETTIV